MIAPGTQKHFILATAGHVDHGKSALVKALTGTDPDRLPEEKARGITIDLGFAELNLSSSDGENIHVGIVDVPGHEDFVRNMIAGVGSIDLALFVIATDDGWMPQTEEHLQILTYLGVSRAVVALTKCDLGDVQETSEQIREKLRDTSFAQSPLIATSVRNGTGIEELKRALASELSTSEPQRDFGKPRLFVDRAFTLHGIGTVVTGTLTGGTLHRGQDVVVQPRNVPARIRSIQTHGRQIELAQPGMRTAINLPDLAIGTSGATIARGDFVTVDSLAPSSTIDVLLHKSPRIQKRDPAARPIKNGALIHLHHGTARVTAKLLLLNDDALEVGAQSIAQLRLDSPILGLLGDRFVIRDPSERYTIAGGIVLDPDGDRESFRSTAQTKLLRARAAANSEDIEVCVASEIRRHGPRPYSSLLQKSRFSADEILAALQRLQNRGEIVIRGEIAADRKSWQLLRNQAVTIIDEAHATNSERAGLDLTALRTSLRNQTEPVFEALISDLCATGFVRRGSTIARRSHQAALPSHLELFAAKILTTLSEKPLDPPARKEIASNQDAKQALGFLIDQGRIVEISSELVLLQENFERMKSAVVEFISQRGPATVSEVRQKLQTSRRIAVPLLEQLDREGVTRRVGDRRMVASSR